MAKNQPTAWVGWVYFASVMMLLVGGMQAMAGLVAIFKDSYFVVAQSQLLVFDYTVWGWIHLIVGLFILCAGLAVMAGKTWGMVVGTFLAVISILTNLAFISAYPLWSLVAIVVDLLVIYALTMHGSETRTAK